MQRKAFTLVEVLVAIILVGMAVASLIGASLSFTRANAAGTELSTAGFLAEQIRELTMPLPVIDPQTKMDFPWGPEPEEATLAAYDDLDDFDGSSFCPPVNAQRGVLSDFAAFGQEVTVENVHAGDFQQVVADHSSSFVRVTVKVHLNSREITSMSWIRARY